MKFNEESVRLVVGETRKGFTDMNLSTATIRRVARFVFVNADAISAVLSKYRGLCLSVLGVMENVAMALIPIIHMVIGRATLEIIPESKELAAEIDPLVEKWKISSKEEGQKPIIDKIIGDLMGSIRCGK